MTNIAIIDYTLGNLQSVYNAICAVGGTTYIAKYPEELKEASHVILPGVGSFNDGISRLIEYGWFDAIKQYVQSGKPFLGICLGMQLLATEGLENGSHQGLDMIKGSVDLMRPDDSSLRVPHIGWNDVTFSGAGQLGKGMNKQEDFYFVHSYVFFPAEESCVIGTCDYGGEFTAVFEHENIFATQFHPEKSQKAGLLLLKNFVEVN